MDDVKNNDLGMIYENFFCRQILTSVVNSCKFMYLVSCILAEECGMVYNRKGAVIFVIGCQETDIDILQNFDSVKICKN